MFMYPITHSLCLRGISCLFLSVPYSLSVPYLLCSQTIWLLYRNMCQVFNRMRVDYLPVYTPSEAEQQDADLFASNVREQMAAHMGVPVTRHSVEDFFLIQQAERAHITVCALLLRGVACILLRFTARSLISRGAIASFTRLSAVSFVYAWFLSH